MTASVAGGPQNAVFRSLTLNEGFDEYGRLAQFIGTNVQAAERRPVSSEESSWTPQRRRLRQAPSRYGKSQTSLPTRTRSTSTS